jgi:hypothetical protein
MTSRENRLRTRLARLRRQEDLAGTRTANAAAALSDALDYAGAAAVAGDNEVGGRKLLRSIDQYRAEKSAAAYSLSGIRREISEVCRELDNLHMLINGALIRVLDDAGKARLFFRDDPDPCPPTLTDASGAPLTDSDGVWFEWGGETGDMFSLTEVLGECPERPDGYTYDRLYAESDVDEMISSAVQRSRDAVVEHVQGALAQAVWNLDY